MAWKNWSYSKKGGFIGAVIALIPCLVYLIILLFASPEESYARAYFIFVLLLSAIFILLVAGIGAFVGWIIGRNKLKRKR